MRVNKITWILFLDIFLVFIFLVLFFNSILFFKCRNEVVNLPDTSNYIMRIHFYGSTEINNTNTVSANISLLDTSNTEIAVIERSWNGTFIDIDFTTVSFANKTYFFPQKIYGTNSVNSKYNPFTPKKGSNLFPYYVENKNCLLFSSGFSYEQKKSLYNLAVFSTSPIAFFMPSVSKKITVNLSNCQGGKTYGLYKDNSGKLFLRED